MVKKSATQNPFPEKMRVLPRFLQCFTPPRGGAALFLFLTKTLHPRTRILVARCARSSNARASHFSSLAIARSSKCESVSPGSSGLRICKFRVPHAYDFAKVRNCRPLLRFLTNRDSLRLRSKKWREKNWRPVGVSTFAKVFPGMCLQNSPA